MKCPYCFRVTRDMPNHLKKYPDCHKKHAEKLRTELEYIFNKLKK